MTSASAWSPPTCDGSEARGRRDAELLEAIRTVCRDHWTAPSDLGQASPLERRRKLTIAAVIAQRQRLEELRDRDQIGPTQYLELQEDLDWKQLSVGTDEDRRITES